MAQKTVYRRKNKKAARRRLIARIAASAVGVAITLTIMTGFVFLFARADAIEQGYHQQQETITQEEPVTITAEQEEKQALLNAELEDVVDQAAGQYNLDAALVRAVIYVESRGVEDADNGLCYGLMQLNKDYTDAFCKGAYVANITAPENNIKAGCWFLADLLQWADGNEDLALMAYNLGQTKAQSWWDDGVRSTKYTVAVQAAKEWYR